MHQNWWKSQAKAWGWEKGKRILQSTDQKILSTGPGLFWTPHYDVSDENHCGNRTINQSSGEERCNLATPPCRHDATNQSKIDDLFQYNTCALTSGRDPPAKQKTNQLEGVQSELLYLIQFPDDHARGGTQAFLRVQGETQPGNHCYSYLKTGGTEHWVRRSSQNEII